VVIVRRGRTYEGLTPEGEQVLLTAHRMLHEHEVLQQALKSDADHPRGRLRLGAIPTAMPMLSRFAALLQARHPGIQPVVLSLSSLALETRLDDLSLDLALGYTDRMHQRAVKLQAWPQYTETYFLLRRADQPHLDGLQIRDPVPWHSLAGLPLCLLTPEMHNRTIMDAAFATAGIQVVPAIETNSVFSLVLSVVDGSVCSVLPGGLLAAVRAYRGLEALPLVAPDVRTPIGFMAPALVRPSRALQAALALAAAPDWLRHASAHSGQLDEAWPL
jgi:DNA-binding transcriptional LysR family regulator